MARRTTRKLRISIEEVRADDVPANSLNPFSAWTPEQRRAGIIDEISHGLSQALLKEASAKESDSADGDRRSQSDAKSELQDLPDQIEQCDLDAGDLDEDVDTDSPDDAGPEEESEDDDSE